MATAEQVLNLERSYLGEGGSRFWKWYGARSGTAWCDIFQSFCLTAVGVPTRFAWVSAHFDNYRANGHFTSTNIREALPGDLVAFEWGSTPGGYDHIAMIEELTPTGAWTLNGNVNGSKVARLWFPFDGGGMAEIARPFYDSSTPENTTSVKEKDMFKLKNVDGRDEYIALTDGGQVLTSFQTTPGSTFTPWTELKPGIAGSNLHAEQAGDGRLCVTVTAAGGLWGSWQTAPGIGPWVDWFNVNDLLKFLSGN